MIRSIRFSAILLGLWLICGITISLAQPPATSSERKAYSDATRIKEPDKKIEALEKFIADFPKSSSISSAHQTIFETLVKNHPEQKEKILAQAGSAIEKAQDFMKPYLYDTLANRLV